MQVAIVTGASGGIGGAIAAELAAHGYYVIVNYFRSRPAAQQIVRDIEAAGGKAAAVCADVRDARQAEALAAAALSVGGALRLLVNNAGVASSGLLQEMDETIYEELFGVNMKGAFLCSKAVLPAMLAQKGGAIINISSMWGVSGASCEALYSASKAALIGFTRALAKEVGPSGIRVNCIAPGLIETKMNAALSAGEKAALIEETPLGRIGAPAEVARAVCFLADEQEAGFITGQVLGVDGGFIL